MKQTPLQHRQICV